MIFMVSPDEPNDKKFLFVLFFAGILMVGLIVLAVTTYSGAPGPGKSDAPAVGTQGIPLTTQPREIITTGSTILAVPSLASTDVPVTTPVRTVLPVQNPTSSPVTSVQPAITGLPVMEVSGDSSDTVVQRPFTLSVSPASASGKPGETISYTLRIDGGEGQTEPIHFTLAASALFFSQTYDIGDEQPPFPKTSVYQFAIPGNIPPGITINGVLTATGAGQTREQPVTLKVL
jgi:hypothetical protein